MRRFTGAVAAVGTALALAVAGLAVVGPSAPAAATRPGPVSLRVATYNIQAGAGADRVFDLARTAAAIGSFGADVVALQEVDAHWHARSRFEDLATGLAGRLGMSVFFAPIYSLDPLTPDAPRREFGNAILSRWRIVSATNHEITRLSTQEPDPVPRLAPGFPEVVLSVRGLRVRVYGTHLDFRADPAVRQAQVADMLAIAGRHRHDPRILLGDLNATAAAVELAPLWMLFRDAWAVANGAAGGETYPAAAPDRRIDYVAVPPDTTVRTVTVPDTLASDHRPVVADLLVSRRR